jgi:hypothetical protein
MRKKEKENKANNMLFLEEIKHFGPPLKAQI